MVDQHGCDTRPAFGPWAPGYYTFTCIRCSVIKIGYKHCRICADCAYTSKGMKRGLCMDCGSSGNFWRNEINWRCYCTQCALKINIDVRKPCYKIEEDELLFMEQLAEMQKVVDGILQAQRELFL